MGLEERMQGVCAKLVHLKYKNTVLKQLVLDLIDENCLDDQGKRKVSQALMSLDK